MNHSVRPSWDDYYINIAWVISQRANCLRRAVGALIVADRRIISTGYNGTPFGVKNCNEEGCLRCSSDAPRHGGYDTCLCVHAEQNAIILAARHGITTDQASLYTTLRPCIDCLKMAIQAGIREIVYDRPFDFDQAREAVYKRLLAESGIIVRRNRRIVPLGTFTDLGPDAEL